MDNKILKIKYKLMKLQVFFSTEQHLSPTPLIYGILFALTLSFFSNDIHSSSAYTLSSKVDETYTAVNLVDDTVIKFSPHSIVFTFVENDHLNNSIR